jgi:ribosomal-protein-alanine N-acetyltransferase
VIDLPVLAGARCTLRALVPGDAASLQRHADDPEVAYNLFDGFPQPYTMAAAEAWCGGESREPRFGHVFGIVVDREVAGCISVSPQGGLWACSAMIGYWLGQAHWRRGITSEALRLLTAWSWTALPRVTRLWMPIYARTAGSQGVARRAGYVLEGRMPLSILKAGAAIDAVQYGLTRPGAQPGEHRLPDPG